MDGIINVNKEAGMTSFDVLRALKRILHEKKMGHAGTLDPMAEGVLLVCVGKATKLVDSLMSEVKIYRAELLLGVETDTEDSTGKLLLEEERHVTEEEVLSAFQALLGKREQIPPMYSAKKVEGKRLYSMAREGIVIERKPSQIEIFSIELLSMTEPEPFEALPCKGKHQRISFRVKCSKGTYIRTLCTEIGEKLGTKACMSALLREEVGEFQLKESKRLSEIEHDMKQGNLSSFLKPALYSKVPTVLTFGKFDGVHIGHQKIFSSVFRISEEEGLRSAVLSFTMEKDSFFLQGRKDMLSTEEEHFTRLKNAGFHEVYLYPLTIEAARMSPEDFVRFILIEALKVKHLVVGTDCSFGYQGAGNVALLKSLQEKYGFQLTVVDKVLTLNPAGEEVEVSSSYIRKALEEGRVEEAAKLLGRPYSINGTVVHGKAIGKSLSFPTANIFPKEGKLTPEEGVYYTRVMTLGEEYDAMTNIGRNPSISAENPLTIESHLLEFDRDIYGEKIRVSFIKRIREQKHFPNLDALKAQLKADLCTVENCVKSKKTLTVERGMQ
ncbi:bifunctional riboflavin kinase/FAD synthetase [Oribacterium parvum]|uniref:bifunctional riboflavin kinase/FAD synthetase n=1 Tax=Oribacterium parvum TaxID=1501329 RepID=UPI0028E408A3|nr:bifunctional riboflavin kinase/FAD synthetase [Oribacterium parvum]